MMRLNFKMIALVCVVLALGCAQASKLENAVCFDRDCVEVEVVQDRDDMQRGLQGRTELGAHKGMLFIFPSIGRHTFWMKDTYINLDIIWLDYARRVVHMEQGVPPCVSDPCPTYTPSQNALYVLEINAGLAAELGVQVGDTAQFNISNLK